MIAKAFQFLGRGWRFPVRPRGGQLELLDGDEKIEQSIWLILSTKPGERVMREDFGCGIHELVFQANTSTLRALVQARVIEALRKWEPRIDLGEVMVESPPDPQNRNLLTITVNYRIRTNNAQNNLVYPFFLNELAT